MDEADYSKFWKLVTELSTRGFWVPRVFIGICRGDANAAIMLQQICYWYKKMGGEFYKRHGIDNGQGWTEELGFSPRQTTYAQNKLVEMGFITTRVGHGKDNKVATFYSVNVQVLMDYLQDDAGAV